MYLNGREPLPTMLEASTSHIQNNLYIILAEVWTVFLKYQIYLKLFSINEPSESRNPSFLVWSRHLESKQVAFC